MSHLRTAAATHTGYLRTTNQDLALATSYLAAIADGMGGHLGGEVAARVAVEELLEAYQDRTTEGLLAAVREANGAVYQRSRNERNLRGMGTTLTAVAVIGDESDGKLRLALVNIGDSRCYLLDRPQHKVHKLTEDHSVVEEMVRSGELTPEEAAVHPHKHILTRVLGIEPTIEADCWELDLDPGSRLLLCSDGLTNELREQEIADVLLDKVDVEAAASELVRSALQRGGTDNVTVVVLEVVAGEASGSPDEVVLLPESIGGTPEAAVAGESDAITEAVALTTAPAPGAAPVASGRPAAADRPFSHQVAASPERAAPVPRTTAPKAAAASPETEERPLPRPADGARASEKTRETEGRQDRHDQGGAVRARLRRGARRRGGLRRLVRQGVVFRRPRQRLRGDIPGAPRWVAVVPTFGGGAHDAEADRPARVECRLPQARDGGELLPGSPQSRARPLARKEPRRPERGRDHYDATERGPRDEPAELARCRGPRRHHDYGSQLHGYNDNASGSGHDNDLARDDDQRPGDRELHDHDPAASAHHDHAFSAHHDPAGSDHDHDGAFSHDYDGYEVRAR